MSVAPRKLSRTEPRILGDTAKPLKRRRLSGTQKAALLAALTVRLQLYPRGYAASKTGPFHSRRAVLGLARAGLMNISATMRYATATKRAREMHAAAVAGGTGWPADPLAAKHRAAGRPDGAIAPDDRAARE